MQKTITHNKLLKTKFYIIINGGRYQFKRAGNRIYLYDITTGAKQFSHEEGLAVSKRYSLKKLFAGFHFGIDNNL